jgi:GTP-binding protein EngB required for normal cell division
MDGGPELKQQPAFVPLILDLCEEAGDRLAGAFGDELAALRASLQERLRVAVVGRVSSGKSTLVNGLLRRRVAPTDVRECTRVVTWYRYGPSERVEVLLRDGSSREVRLDRDGLLPRHLDVELAEVAALQVWLSCAVLKSLVLIDTPGISSVNERRRDQTAAQLTEASVWATARADAIVFLLNQSLREDELDSLHGFRAAFEDSLPQSVRTGAVNAVAVLSKADKLNQGAEPWRSALDLAARLAARHRDDVVTVLPLVGLLGETGAAGRLRESDVAHLRELAGALDAQTQALLLSAPDLLLEASSAVPPDRRAALLELLDLYGLDMALNRIRDGVVEAAALNREVYRRSGLAELHELLVGTFRDRATALKAARVLAELERIAYGDAAGAEEAAALAWLRDEVERVRLDPATHRLAEVAALQACVAGEVRLPADRLQDLERMADGGRPGSRLGLPTASPAQLAAAALEGQHRWRSFAFSAGPRVAHVASVMDRSYRLLRAELGDGNGR